MLIIDNLALVRLAKKPAIAAEFPFLKAAREPSCSCAGKKPVDLNAIKAQLASLGDEGRKRLKELAKVDQIKVIYRNDREIVSVVF